MESDVLRGAYKLLTKHDNACRTADLPSQQLVLPDSREQSAALPRLLQADAA